MQNIVVFIVFSSLTWVTISLATEMIRDNLNEGHGQFSPFIQDLSSLLADDKSESSPKCLSKDLFANVNARHRRASISRPYFHHWRAARENSRPSMKNFLAFSPRLGRSMDDGESWKSLDSDLFGISLFGRINEKKYSLIYEDSTKICSVQLNNEDLLGEILDKVGANRN